MNDKEKKTSFIDGTATFENLIHRIEWQLKGNAHRLTKYLRLSTKSPILKNSLFLFYFTAVIENQIQIKKNCNKIYNLDYINIQVHRISKNIFKTKWIKFLNHTIKKQRKRKSIRIEEQATKPTTVNDRLFFFVEGRIKFTIFSLFAKAKKPIIARRTWT